MQKLEIKGGKRISGIISISGSKNATLPILASTILTNKKVVIKSIDFNEKGDLLINGRPALKFRIVKKTEEGYPNEDDMKKIRKRVKFR